MLLVTEGEGEWFYLNRITTNVLKYSAGLLYKPLDIHVGVGYYYIPTISYSRYITLSILTDVYSLKIRAGELLPTSPPTPPRHIFVFIPQFSSSTDTIAFLSSWCLKLLKLSLFPRLRGSVSRWILSCERYILLHDTFGCKKFNKLDKSKEQLVFVSSKYLSPLLSSAPAAPESPGQLGPSPPEEWLVVATQVWSMKN